MKERLSFGLIFLLMGAGMLWFGLSATGRRLYRRNRLLLRKYKLTNEGLDELGIVILIFSGAIMCVVGCVVLFNAARAWLDGTADD